MQIPKSFLVACAATFFLVYVSKCSADDATTTNAPAASEITTNATQAAQSMPLTKAEKKKLAEDKKKADKAAKAEADKAKAGGTNTPPAQASVMKKAPAMAPIAGPPNPLSAEKQQRLAELLKKYKADQVSPEEYHKERAKILAEP